MYSICVSGADSAVLNCVHEGQKMSSAIQAGLQASTTVIATSERSMQSLN